MKNEKKVSAKYHNIFYENDEVGSKWYYILPEIDKSPEIISAYGHDYIREDKIQSGVDRALYEVISNGTNNYEKDKEEKTELKVGDIVVLRSGSHRMTIVGFKNEKGRVEWDSIPNTICTWYNSHKELYQTEYIPVECLEKVEKEYIGYDGCELDCDKVDCDMYEDIEEMIEAYRDGVSQMYKELTK